MKHISTMYARFTAKELALKGAALDEALGSDGVNAVTLFSDRNMPYQQFFYFLEKIRTLDDDPALGLRVGQKLTPMSLGNLGNAMLSAPNLLDSLNLACEFGQIDTPYFPLTLKADIHDIHLSLTETEDLGSTRQFQTEVFASVAQNLIEAITGQTFSEGHFQFAYPAPKYAKSYREFLHSKVSFGSDKTKISIPKSIVRMQSTYSDPDGWQNHRSQLLKQLKALEEVDELSMAAKVNSYLSACPPPLPNIKQMAAHLHTSERTLCRKLKTEATSFREIRQGVLIDLAKSYLIDSDLSVDAIAYQLGYLDNSSFRRSFKKLVNMSPQAYRSINNA